MKHRPGTTLIELTTVLAMLGIVLGACGMLLHSQSMLFRNVSERAGIDEALRTARGVLRAEVRNAAAGDIHAIGKDSVALRVFRGWAIVCGVSAGQTTLRYRGLRDPDDTKDSLLIVGPERVSGFRASGAQPTGCPRNAEEQLIVVTPALTMRPGIVLLFFETGAYHLANGALRYRRGAEGRQPLTDDELDERHSQFASQNGGRGLSLILRGVAVGKASPLMSETPIAFLNLLRP